MPLNGLQKKKVQSTINESPNDLDLYEACNVFFFFRNC